MLEPACLAPLPIAIEFKPVAFVSLPIAIASVFVACAPAVALPPKAKAPAAVA